MLTTHYLDEAQALADRVAIIKDRRILAEGPPGELGRGGGALQDGHRDEKGGAHQLVTDDPTRS